MSIDTLRRNLHRSLVLLLACVVAAPVWAQRGALTVPRNLNQLTDRATDIVRGTVVSARVEKHPEFTNLDTVVVTLRVRETLKGQAQGTFTFRQYIWDIRDTSGRRRLREGPGHAAAPHRAECLRAFEPRGHGPGAIPDRARPLGTGDGPQWDRQCPALRGAQCRGRERRCRTLLASRRAWSRSTARAPSRSAS